MSIEGAKRARSPEPAGQRRAGRAMARAHAPGRDLIRGNDAGRGCATVAASADLHPGLVKQCADFSYQRSHTILPSHAPVG
jgi:hypothetical protein